MLLRAPWVEDSGFDRVSFASVLAADHLLTSIYQFKPYLLEPAVTNSPDGEVVFEWSSKSQSVTTYVTESQIDLLTAWGPNTETQMTHLEGATHDDVIEALTWLES